MTIICDYCLDSVTGPEIPERITVSTTHYDLDIHEYCFDEIDAENPEEIVKEVEEAARRNIEGSSTKVHGDVGGLSDVVNYEYEYTVGDVSKVFRAPTIGGVMALFRRFEGREDDD